MTRVLIVAAYAAVRAGLHALLAEARDCEVVAEVSGSAELAALLGDTAADVLLLDSSDGDSGRVIAAAGANELAVVALSDNPEDYGLLLTQTLPGWALLDKDARRGELEAAVHAAASGLIVLDRAFAPPLRPAPTNTSSPSSGASGTNAVLTARETEVLQLIAEGLPNKSIAARLRISQHTVKFHVASILAKLGAASRTEAVTVGARYWHFMAHPNYHLPSTIYHLPSTIYHLPSTIVPLTKPPAEPKVMLFVIYRTSKQVVAGLCRM